MNANALRQAVAVRGCTDLTLGDLKFSGNAQRRKRDWLLFHGTFLLDFDLALIGEVLRPPPRPPAYRQERAHADFLTRLPLPAASIKAALAEAWCAVPQPGEIPRAAIAKLARERYATDEWNLKF